jgi:hypothetical protein
LDATNVAVPVPDASDDLPLNIPFPVAVSNCPDATVKPPFAFIAPEHVRVPFDNNVSPDGTVKPPSAVINPVAFNVPLIVVPPELPVRPIVITEFVFASVPISMTGVVAPEKFDKLIVYE